jgi:hypothetical protein
MYPCTRSRRIQAPTLREFYRGHFPKGSQFSRAHNTPTPSLQQRKASEWKGQVDLLFGDMRSIVPPELADIIVSELLGSFGDNELSPECLDGAMRFLKRMFLLISLVTGAQFHGVL